MSGDQIAIAAVAILLVAHVVALFYSAILRRGPPAVLSVNLLFAATVVGWILLTENDLITETTIDWPYVEMITFEVAVVAATIAAFCHVRFALPVACLFFGANFLANVGAVVFIMTFRITRLV